LLGSCLTGLAGAMPRADVGRSPPELPARRRRSAAFPPTSRPGILGSEARRRWRRGRSPARRSRLAPPWHQHRTLSVTGATAATDIAERAANGQTRRPHVRPRRRGLLAAAARQPLPARVRVVRERRVKGAAASARRAPVVGLVAAAALVTALPATAEEPATYAGYSAPGCGRLGVRNRHDPAPDGSDAFIKTASFDILCESGSTARVGIQIDTAGMLLVRRFYYFTGSGRDASWTPSVEAAILGACGCR